MKSYVFGSLGAPEEADPSAPGTRLRGSRSPSIHRIRGDASARWWLHQCRGMKGHTTDFQVEGKTVAWFVRALNLPTCQGYSVASSAALEWSSHIENRHYSRQKS